MQISRKTAADSKLAAARLGDTAAKQRANAPGIIPIDL